MLTGNKVPPEVTEITTQLALDLRKILGDRLVGLYLCSDDSPPVQT